MDCKVSLSTSYHPQMHGLIEHFHRTIKQVLTCYGSAAQEQWCQLLSQCELALNSTFQDTIQNAPFAVVHSFGPTVPLGVHLDSVQLPTLQNLVKSRKDVQQRIFASLKDSQVRMARTVDHQRSALTLDVGLQVWLSTKHLPLCSVSRKLSALWAGPYTVLTQIGDVAY